MNGMTSPPGKYRAFLELGQGGTANVYLGVAHGPVGFNKLVVLKALKRNLSGDEEFRRMFINEARLSARLNHPNIVQVNEVVEQEGLPVIVMEYLEGKALSDIRNRMGNSLDRDAHLRIICEALGGLHYSHELTDYDGTPLNVVHRDMTPHNVFVTYDGGVKVLDFGIAKLAGSLVETKTGVIKGKLRYMPPEQIAGEEIDRRTDVFAVGVMLWEAATRTRMWHDMSEATIMNRVLRGEIPAPHDVCDDVPADLERICLKALAYEREDRYATVADLQRELETYLETTATIRMRDIGKQISEAFKDSRNEAKRIIEEQLSQLTLNSDEGDTVIIPPSNSLRSQTFTAASSTLEVDASLHGGNKFVRNLMVALVLGVLLAGSGFMFAQSRADVTTSAAQAEAVPSAPPAPEVVPSAAAVEEEEPQEENEEEPKEQKPAKVTMRVTVFPSSAELTIDGKAVAGNPYYESVMADGSSHVVEASASGYESKELTLVYDRNREVVLNLERKRPTWRPRPSSPEPKEVAAPPKPSTDCAVPFYVDERGIKKYKPGCL